MSDKKITFVDWLGVNIPPEFSNAPRVGKVVGAGLFLIALIVILMAVVGVIQLFGAMVGFGPYADDTTGAAIRNLGLFLFALFGAPFLVWRSMVAQQQVKVAEQSQITDRINKAVEGLGSVKSVKVFERIPKYYVDENGAPQFDPAGHEIPLTNASGDQIFDQLAYEKTEPNLEVRMGAIYALERIAQDSLRDHFQIMEILSAYIRENAPHLPSYEEAFSKSVEKPRADVQAAITVIGRRSEKQIEMEWQREIRLDLSRSNLSKIVFLGGNYSAVDFSNCIFDGANFRDSKLIGTYFFGARLNHVDFFNAQMKGARLDYATINQPKVPVGEMSASITFAKKIGMTVVGADLSAINYLGENQEMNSIFGSRDTILHRDLEFDRNTHKNHHNDVRKLRGAGKIALLEKLQHGYYSQNRFVDWSPFESDDTAYLHLHAQFKQRLGLVGFPYERGSQKH